MNDETQEHKQTAEDKSVNENVNDTIDNFLSGDKSTPSEQTETTPEPKQDEVPDETLDASSPENKDADESKEPGTEPDKTESSEEKSEEYEGVPKGYANNPAWQKREQKLKDTQLGKDQAESQLNQLLGDPTVYQRYLERQGKDQTEIVTAMRSRGMDVSKLVQGNKQIENQDIMDQICEREKWDKEALQPEQKAYLKDVFTAMDNRMNDMFDKKMAEKLGPIENHVKTEQDLQEGRKDYELVQETAKKEFPGLAFDKDIRPAMTAYLDYLDKIDPKAEKYRPTHMEVYEKATRNILIERSGQKVRQEARNDKKINARPLRQGAENPRSNVPAKGRTINETIDNYWADRGM